MLKVLRHEDMTVSGQFCSEFIFNHIIQNAPVRVMKKISDKSLGSNKHKYLKTLTQLQVSIHVPVLSIRSDRLQETLSMPKHNISQLFTEVEVAGRGIY